MFQYYNTITRIIYKLQKHLFISSTPTFVRYYQDFTTQQQHILHTHILQPPFNEYMNLQLTIVIQQELYFNIQIILSQNELNCQFLIKLRGWVIIMIIFGVTLNQASARDKRKPPSTQAQFSRFSKFATTTKTYLSLRNNIPYFPTCNQSSQTIFQALSYLGIYPETKEVKYPYSYRLGRIPFATLSLNFSTQVKGAIIPSKHPFDMFPQVSHGHPSGELHIVQISHF
eukprot:TRINITY_DN16357_c0_g1_i1.p1 TRINITY_DN16357_c0_g1~~TRINITY_DN16357_c0_g1_i1.p1  ORF type:complete len:228 (-),score=-16.41 TRINITY_DN16357_c0_g1_i1:68-751(-)